MENKSTQAREYYEVFGLLIYDQETERMFLDVELFVGPWLSTSPVQVQGRLYRDPTGSREAVTKTE